MKQLDVGPLRVTLHRTVRVALGETSALPPNLGEFPIYKVSDYRETCPPQWEDNAVFVAMHDKEALWMSFSRIDNPKNKQYRYEPSAPLAVLVGAGGINALSGEKLGTKLEKDNYMVTPPQPWLDGWKDQDGTVYQFVTTEYKKGEGLTVGEQIMKEECKTGGIGIAVFEAKEPEKLVPKHKPRQYGGPCGQSMKSFGGAQLECLGSSDDECTTTDFDSGEEYTCSLGGLESKGIARGRKVKEMGVGKGGKINQKIYPDPHGLEVWKEQPEAAVAVYLVNAEQFSEITVHAMPPMPKSVEEYHGLWYGLKDKEESDIAGAAVFTGLKTAFSGDTSNVVAVKEKE